MWILIMFLSMGPSGGVTIYSVVFSSKQTCEMAQKALPRINVLSSQASDANGTMASVCVHK